MQLMTLNIWGGHVQGPLLEFVKALHEIDIFCFQEVYHNAPRKISDEDRYVCLNIFDELKKVLPHHQAFFRAAVNEIYGIAMFVKNDVEVLAEGEVRIHEDPTYSGIGPAHGRNLQWVDCSVGERAYTIANVHCLWNGRGKTDTPERIEQSKKMREFVATRKQPVVLCGDFNLRPDTESLHIASSGMRNLIEEYKITSTRTSLYPKDEKFADYVFTSPQVSIKHFEVLSDEVSDHSPLLLEFC